VRWYHDWYRLDHIAFCCTHNDRRFFHWVLSLSSLIFFPFFTQHLFGFHYFGIHWIVTFGFLGLVIWILGMFRVTLLPPLSREQTAEATFSFVCISRVDERFLDSI
jgi:hypothetical protein